MSRPGGNPDLKGKKGRSGRKRVYDEQLKKLVIEKAWGKVLKKLRNMDDKEIEKIALEIVKKTIPQKIEGEINATFKWKE